MIYSESDLIIPTLNLLSTAGNDGLTTSELISLLLDNLDISPEDLEKRLKDRNDTPFHQKTRNLLGSHWETNALGREGLSTKEDTGKNSIHKITEKGLEYLAEHGSDYEYLIKSGFTEKQRKEVADKDYKGLIIEEGSLTDVTPKKKRKRSSKLATIARDHYMSEGLISCHGCGFTFNKFYGETARNYIEIHHLKPIHTYEDEDTSKSLEDALKNVRPLCSNCHRMVHRNAGQLLSIEDLNQLVKTHGAFTVGA